MIIKNVNLEFNRNFSDFQMYFVNNIQFAFMLEVVHKHFDQMRHLFSNKISSKFDLPYVNI